MGVSKPYVGGFVFLRLVVRECYVRGLVSNVLRSGMFTFAISFLTFGGWGFLRFGVSFLTFGG